MLIDKDNQGLVGTRPKQPQVGSPARDLPADTTANRPNVPMVIHHAVPGNKPDKVLSSSFRRFQREDFGDWSVVSGQLAVVRCSSLHAASKSVCRAAVRRFRHRTALTGPRAGSAAGRRGATGPVEKVRRQGVSSQVHPYMSTCRARFQESICPVRKGRNAATGHRGDSSRSSSPLVVHGPLDIPAEFREHFHHF
jgi:hypothetical protein